MFIMEVELVVSVGGSEVPEVWQELSPVSSNNPVKSKEDISLMVLWTYATHRD
jgi:hypothetical protein